MNELDELKVKGYAQLSAVYLEKHFLTREDNNKLEDIFYNLWDISEMGLSEEMIELRSNTLEKIAIKQRIV